MPGRETGCPGSPCKGSRSSRLPVADGPLLPEPKPLIRRVKRRALATAEDHWRESASPRPRWKEAAGALNVGLPALSTRPRASIPGQRPASFRWIELSWRLRPTKQGIRKSVARRTCLRPTRDPPDSRCRRRFSREWRTRKNAPRIVHYDEPRSPCRLSSQGGWSHATKYENDSAHCSVRCLSGLEARVPPRWC